MPRLLVLAACLACLPALAGNIGELETQVANKATKYNGYEHRASVNKAQILVGEGNDAAAWAALEPVLAYCEKERSIPDRLLISVLNPTEEAEVRSSKDRSTTIFFVDIACPSANKSAAFLAVREKHPERAFEYLDRAESLAPLWAEPVAERAYLVGSLGDRTKALAIYRDALVLAEKHEGSSYMKPLILRGIGFSLTELGDLDGAQHAYEDCLKIEPSSELAKNELRYIEKLRAKRKGI